MQHCEVCGTSESTRFIKSRKLNQVLCANCYQSYNRNPDVFPIPPYGVITRDPNDKPICHICGRAFDALMTHARQTHRISEAEYKERFGLDAGKGITSFKTWIKFRRSNQLHYHTVVKQNLIKRGQATRFQPGSPGRTKDKVRHQTYLRLIKQFKRKDD